MRVADGIYRVIKTAWNRLKPRHAKLAGGLALLTAAVGMSSLQAQTAPLEVTDSLNLPQDINFLTDANPNLRTATAVVNDYVITLTDIDQRVALILDANDAEVSAEELQRLKMQTLRNLIDETLQIQDSKAQELDVERSDIVAQYNRVANQNGFTPEELDKHLIEIGSSRSSLQRQIEGELAMRNLTGRMSLMINVSEEEVNEVVARIRASKGNDEYRIGEIYLSATSESEQAVAENARRIVEQLQQGGSFVAYARQFSEASTASVGGDLGWVQLGQLPNEISSAMRQMNPGQLQGPIRVPGGFSIILMIDRRKILMADPRDAVLSLKQIAISFPEGTTEADARAQASNFAAQVERIRGCGDVDGVAARMGADVRSNDQVLARNLPAALQDIVLNLNIGQATSPFGSLDDGISVLMLCGREDPQVELEVDPEAVMDQLLNERINKRAQRYLRDLRRDAIIEYH